MTEPHVHISASPHIHNKKSRSIREIMLYVIIALLPSLIWGIISFGYKAALVVIVSVVVAVLTEFLIDKFLKHDISSLKDLSAVVTGLLVGLNLSSEVPLYVPLVASLFAIAVCKMPFGGIGQNIANPAIGGRLFVMFSFTGAMSKYAVPRFLKGLESTVSAATSMATSMATSSATSMATSSATSMATSIEAQTVTTSLLSGATPLSFVKALPESGVTPIEAMANAGYPYTPFAESVGSFFHINPYYIDAFFGNISGSIGEISAFLLILGGVILLVKKIISYHIPVSFLLSFMFLTWMFGGVPQNLGLFKGDAFYGVLTGGLLIGCIFMATDMVTTPLTHKGQVIFGIGCGFFTFFFRTFASLPEGVSIAILIMNIATPLIDKFTKPRVLGTEKKHHKRVEVAK